ncbi:MAG: TIGR04283 family arsenosugar biosynthesis glycosyltransferase [Caulobacter sp.]|nr:TIGR04283 family arsenosugar biosynthesis glycosyltransferase [Caulobacter sp.]
MARERPRLSVVIPTLTAAEGLAATLAALDPADEIIVVDGGSRDGTAALARDLGARVIETAPGRGCQLAAGAASATADWLLFLHADTVLPPGWRDVVAGHFSAPRAMERAACFRFALDDDSPQARRLERWVAWRVAALALPYGDQGLLIHRTLYDAVGGYRPLPLMEDVDLVRRLGRRRLTVLDASATTSARRWRQDGWLARSARNLLCLALFHIGVPAERIARLYGR